MLRNTRFIHAQVQGRAITIKARPYPFHMVISIYCTQNNVLIEYRKTISSRAILRASKVVSRANITIIDRRNRTWSDVRKEVSKLKNIAWDTRL